MEEHVRFTMFFNFFCAGFEPANRKSMRIVRGSKANNYGIIRSDYLMREAGKKDSYSTGQPGS